MLVFLRFTLTLNMCIYTSLLLQYLLRYYSERFKVLQALFHMILLIKLECTVLFKFFVCYIETQYILGLSFSPSRILIKENCLLTVDSSI
jgi:hypothetical protein